MIRLPRVGVTAKLAGSFECLTHCADQPPVKLQLPRLSCRGVAGMPVTSCQTTPWRREARSSGTPSAYERLIPPDVDGCVSDKPKMFDWDDQSTSVSYAGQMSSKHFSAASRAERW